MIRTCANPKCRRAWSDIWNEKPQTLCPTCRAGMKPLSRLRGGRAKSKVKK